MPRRRTAAELDLLMRQLGTDLDLDFRGPAGYFEDADLATVRSPDRAPRRTDLGVVSGLDAAEQLLANRLKTQLGELAPLGHPDYGSRHHELVGEPNVARTRNLIKLYVLEALGREPRVEKVLGVRVYAPHDPPRDQVRVELEVLLIGEPNPLNFVVPFSLEVAA
ncbi:MAG TPA: GPW/gp25 family protein [Gaiellaceae bacterium]|jgi:phage baseplate assembly protein W|nr:GPW/gp25 family protein [Gaiellaceae bacterium]